jgi:predicted DNA-binding protein YlxM (UPF0122 family)
MGKTRPTDPNIIQFFANPVQQLHRQYLALRSFYFEEKSADEVAAQYGYSVNAVYALAKNFKSKLENSKQNGAELFFQELKMGRPKLERNSDLVEIIVNFRKKQLSVPDIKILLDSKGYDVSEGLIYRVCDENGFARLPKRGIEQRQELMERSGYVDVVKAPVSIMHPFTTREQFSACFKNAHYLLTLQAN